jgi:hypothetical protein
MTSARQTGRALVRARIRDERGVALIIALMVSSLMIALAAALMLTTMTERRISANFGRAVEARYAADAGIERVVHEMFAADWDAILSGVVTSSFVDGAPGGIRTLPGGSQLDLGQATHLLRCGKATCSSADLIAITAERPWGTNNPLWQLYAYSPIDRLLPAGAIDSHTYVVVWVADDSSESDGDPLHDGGAPAGCDPSTDPTCADRNAGRGVVEMMARAFGPDGTQRTVAVTLARASGNRVLSWREVR